MRFSIIGLFFCAVVGTGATASPVLSKSKAFIPEGVEIAPEFRKGKKGKKDFAVIGKDDRVKQLNTQDYPYRALGQLIFDKSTCSASLIGPSHILTAAHCIYNQTTSSFVESAYFAPGRLGAQFPHGLYKVSTAYLPKLFMTTESFGVADIAVLKLSNPAGDKLGWFGVSLLNQMTDEDFAAINEYVFGPNDNSVSPFKGKSDIHKDIDELTVLFPQYTASYFGYSGDKDNEMWGDSCIYIQQGEPIEKYQMVQTFCDSQPGSSGSGYFDENFYISSVRSFQGATSENNVVRDGSGKKTPFIKGDYDEVYNYNLGINNYAMQLIVDWKNDIVNEETAKHNFRFSGAEFIENRKSFSITNKCGEKMWIAARYRDIDNDWVDDGFYEKEYGEKASFRVTSDYFYFIAQSDNHRWDGSDTYVTLYGEEYGMKKRAIGNVVHENINLNCD